MIEKRLSFDVHGAVKKELAASAPDVFVPAGIPKKRRSLLFEGDKFRWQAR